jgi:tetratricopeptide (TPR) repeat protein
MDAELRFLGESALAHERAGRWNDAEAAYTRLLALCPDLPDTWFNLAVVQRKAGRFDAALASYQQALDRGITQPEEVHLNRGVIYADCLRRDEAARLELRAALAINPRYVPALLNLANLHEDLGRREDALALYERLLDIEPRCYPALARYASLKTAMHPDPTVVDRLVRTLEQPGLSAADRAMLEFALGGALEKAGAYGLAFAAVSRANEQSRRSAGPGGARYDPQAHERFIDELIAAFPAPRQREAPATGVQPIFVCGMFRSGSTLVEQLLGGHPRVAAGGEIGFLPTAVRKELAPFPASMSRLTSLQADDLARRYLDLLARLHPGAERVVDKRPDNFLYIGLIKLLFPTTKVIHTTRDPLDNCLSVYFLHLDHGMPYALDLLDTGHYYCQYRRLMAHWRSLYGDDIVDVEYDRLVREPRVVVERMLAAEGLEWDEQCMAFHERTGAVKTASVWQVRQPLYQHSSGRAGRFAPHLDVLDAYLKRNLIS